MDSSLFFRSNPSNVTPLLLPKHKSLQSNNWSISVPCRFSMPGSWIQKLLELLAATSLVWMWRPAREATVRLRTTKGDSWRRCIDATPSVKAELENTFPWKKCTDWRWRQPNSSLQKTIMRSLIGGSALLLLLRLVCIFWKCLPLFWTVSKGDFTDFCVTTFHVSVHRWHPFWFSLFLTWTHLSSFHTVLKTFLGNCTRVTLSWPHQWLTQS